MGNEKIDIVSLRVIKLYFLGIRELNFPKYHKQFKQIDVELFIELADVMENLTELGNFLELYLVDLNEMLLSVSINNYSPTVHRMISDMKEELEKII